MEGALGLSRVQKKLAEAQFFLGKMTEEDRRIFGHGGLSTEPFEPFDYYLSAFLSAGRTIDYRLRHEQPHTYPNWRSSWDATLSPSENRLIKFLIDDRNDEVHQSGSIRSEAQEGVEFPIGTHHVGGSMISISGPPGMPPTVVFKRTFLYTIDGTKRPVIEACTEYLALLARMAKQFKVQAFKGPLLP
jgi:hypothetical protein